MTETNASDVRGMAIMTRLIWRGLMAKILTNVSRNEVKEQIVARLHKRVGICMHCGCRNCAHSNTELPTSLDRGDVLWAINLDNHFEVDDSV